MFVVWEPDYFCITYRWAEPDMKKGGEVPPSPPPTGHATEHLPFKTLQGKLLSFIAFSVTEFET